MFKKKMIYNGIALVLMFALIAWLEMNKSNFSHEISTLQKAAIYAVVAVAMNMLTGFTGLFSLGQAGFMAIGAYTVGILTIPVAQRGDVYYIEGISPLIANIYTPFWIAIILGGVFAAVVAVVIGIPVLRLKSDYLAIATLGFSEIIRIIFTNTQSLTNGALGLKGIDKYTNVWWSWGIAIISIIFMVFLIKSSYGRAFKAIREDEIAAEAMGINLYKHKMMAFVIGSMMAGIGGALLAHLIRSIDPLMFRFVLTFNILLIVVLGGIGSITGSTISAIVVTVMLEKMRFLDQAIDIGNFHLDGIPGMRMVIFSALLMLVILFYPRGLMGREELTWNKIFSKFGNKKNKEVKQEQAGD